MKALLKKGFDVRLGNLGELLGITKYNHGWPPLMWSLEFLFLGCKKSPEVLLPQSICGATFSRLSSS